MSRLFNRDYIIAIDGRLVAPPLQVKFDVEVMASRSSGKATLEMVNLSQASIGHISTAKTLEIYAGYEGISGLIFHGALTPRGITAGETSVKIESLAHPIQIAESSVNLSLIGEVTPSQVLSKIASTIGLATSKLLTNTNLKFDGWAFVGKAKLALDDLAELIGGAWWVSGGVLYLGDSTAVQSEVEVLVNAETGLIGAPTKGNGLVTFTSLLNPLLLPATRVKLESKYVTGTYRIHATKFTGDYRGGDWKAEVRCRQA